MESKVFGNPITNSTLEGMSEYAGKKITRTDRARVALNMKNADGKEDAVRKYLETLHQLWPNTNLVVGFIYNATGEPIVCVDEHVWRGSKPVQTFPLIGNGQFGIFLHSGTPQARAALVYRVQNEANFIFDYESDWMLSWSAPDTPTNKAYTEIREPGHFTGRVWREVEMKLEASGPMHADKQRGLIAMVGIVPQTLPIYGAIIMLDKFQPPPFVV